MHHVKGRSVEDVALLGRTRNVRPDLSFYEEEMDISDVNLEELTRFAWDRITLLQKIDQASRDFTMRIGVNDKDAKIITAAINQFYQMDDGSVAFLNPRLTSTMKDTLSHQIVRLALASDPRLSTWLLRAETYMFRFRFENSSTEENSQFFTRVNLKFQKCSKEDLDTHTDKIRSLYRFLYKAEFPSSEDIYKVDFIEAIDLIAQKRVLLADGYAFVFRSDLIDLVVPIFRSKVNAQITLARSRLRQQHLEPQLEQTFSDILSRCHDSTEYKKKTTSGVVSVESLPELAEKSFPLCMRSIYDSVQETSHAKHGGRMQLGLFLKAIGLSLDDSLTYWRREFTKKMPVDKFDKTHAYNIRHNYGKEGKMVDYSPYGCNKIINESLAVGDSHGCPYKHFSETDLRSYVLKRGISEVGASEIINLKRGKEYQLACKRFF
eukprot:TRINITY_DN4025_c0_g1_i1.p1 TRINITY_DN4025_c0_g1~~TRINITY_DN4025_c0_g1_i1.p1  ORF type:complete len:435 (-),score=86.33 TRINITY_DN4025_c0_g1_i1:327-1631(-)